MKKKAKRAPGRKDDQGKLAWDQIPWKAMEQVVEASMFGAEKYGVDNWKKVRNKRRRYWSAAMRHAIAYYRGERKDPDTGLNPLAHAVIDLLFLLELETK